MVGLYAAFIVGLDYAIEQIRVAVTKLRDMSPLWDMYKEGIDLSTVEWAHH